MEKLPLDWVKRLYFYFVTGYGDRFNRSHTTEEIINLWWDSWANGLAGFSAEQIKAAIDDCLATMDWPPSLPEFRRLCEKASGVPTCAQCLSSAIRGEMNHPITYIAYLKVGSWAMKNDKDEVLQKKFAVAYGEALSEYRDNPEKAHGLLADYSTKPKELPPPSKIPTQEEIKGFKERLAEYQTKAHAEKEKKEKEAGGHPVWDKQQLARGGSNFDERVFNERKRYLLSLNEHEAGTLEREDWYDRTRYLRELAAIDHLNRVGNTGSSQPPPSGSSNRRPSGKGYVKDWMND